MVTRPQGHRAPGSPGPGQQTSPPVTRTRTPVNRTRVTRPQLGIPPPPIPASTFPGPGHRPQPRAAPGAHRLAENLLPARGGAGQHHALLLQLPDDRVHHPRARPRARLRHPSPLPALRSGARALAPLRSSEPGPAPPAGAPPRMKLRPRARPAPLQSRLHEAPPTHPGWAGGRFPQTPHVARSLVNRWRVPGARWGR